MCTHGAWRRLAAPRRYAAAGPRPPGLGYEQILGGHHSFPAKTVPKYCAKDAPRRGGADSMAAVTTSTDIRRRAAAGLDAAAAAAAVAPVQSSPRRIAASCAVLVTLVLICAVAASVSDVRDGTSESFGPASGKVLAQGLGSAFVIETSASNRRHHRQLAAAFQDTGAGTAHTQFHTQIHSHGAAPRSSGLLRAAEKRVSAYLRDMRGGGEHAQQDGGKADGKGQDDRQSTGQKLQRSSCAVLISGLRQRFLYRDSNANYTGLDVFVSFVITFCIRKHGAIVSYYLRYK
eukprot:COSAG01_NODE_16117_length_1268_cov_4.875962_1_plen_289_part_00